eukprot:jgi/Psemu1/5995/gm1.5995_g
MNRKSSKGSNTTTPDRKFTGLNQDELKGLVANDSNAQQYDKLFECNKLRKDDDGNEIKVIDAIKQQMPSNFIKGQLTPNVRQQLKFDDAVNKASRFFSCKQDINKNAATHVDETKARLDALKPSGIHIILEEMTKHTLTKMNPTNTYEMDKKLKTEAKKVSLDEMEELVLLAILTINEAHPKLHHNVAGVLKDNYSLGTGVYPLTQLMALELMYQYKASNQSNSGNNTVTTVATTPEARTLVARKIKSNTTNATSLTTKGVETYDTDSHQMLMTGVEEGHFDDDAKIEHLFSQSNRSIDPNLILFASQATCNCISNSKLLQSVDKTQPVIYSKNRSADSARVLPNGTTTHIISAKIEHLFSQSNISVDPNLILFASQATCNCISNPKLLRNIHIHLLGKGVNIHCNAGCVTLKHGGNLPGFGMVWYQEGRMANALSLSLVSDGYRITLDTSISQSFFIHKEEESTRKLIKPHSSESILAITTMKGQKQQFYSDLDIRHPTKARTLQDTLGFPQTVEFLHMIDNNLKLNCPVTRRNELIGICRAEDEYFWKFGIWNFLTKVITAPELARARAFHRYPIFRACACRNPSDFMFLPVKKITKSKKTPFTQPHHTKWSQPNHSLTRPPQPLATTKGSLLPYTNYKKPPKLRIDQPSGLEEKSFNNSNNGSTRNKGKGQKSTSYGGVVATIVTAVEEARNKNKQGWLATAAV